MHIVQRKEEEEMKPDYTVQRYLSAGRDLPEPEPEPGGSGLGLGISWLGVRLCRGLNTAAPMPNILCINGVEVSDSISRRAEVEGSGVGA